MTVFVPSSMVMGLSVFSLIVKQGIPSQVVSSCSPPLSEKQGLGPHLELGFSQMVEVSNGKQYGC